MLAALVLIGRWQFALRDACGPFLQSLRDEAAREMSSLVPDSVPSGLSIDG